MFSCNGRYREDNGIIVVGKKAVTFTKDESVTWSTPKGLVPPNSPPSEEEGMKDGDKVSIPLGSMLDVKLEEYHKEGFDFMITPGNPGFSSNYYNSRKAEKL